MDVSPLSPGEFGAAFKGFLEQAVSQAPVPEPVFLRRIRDHLDAELAHLAILSEEFDASDHPNLQLALDAYLAVEGRSAELIGVTGPHGRFMGINLADLVTAGRPGLMGGMEPTEGPVEYTNFHLGDDEVLRCVQSAVVLIADGDSRLAAVLILAW